MEVPGKIIRKQYYRRSLGRNRDKTLRVTAAEYDEIVAVEIRDWVKVPTGLGGNIVEQPSFGAIIPLAEVIAVRKALQRIEVDYGLTEEGE